MEAVLWSMLKQGMEKHSVRCLVHVDPSDNRRGLVYLVHISLIPFILPVYLLLMVCMGLACCLLMTFQKKETGMDKIPDPSNFLRGLRVPNYL